MSDWVKLQNYINKFPIGSEITRQQIINDVIYRFIDVNFKYYSNDYTVDYYISDLKKIGFLEIVKRGVYKKKYNIPKSLTTTILKDFARKKTWKSWFIPLYEILGVKEKDVPKQGL